MTSEPMTPRALGDRDAPHVSPITPSEDARTVMLNEISWGAVFAGVVVALVVQAIINLLAVSAGTAVLDPVGGQNPSASSFSMAAGTVWIVSGLIASACGGYVAGRLAGRPVESTCGWHGLVSWAMTTVVVLYLITSAAGGILGGALSSAGSVLGGLGRSTATAAQIAAPAASQITDPFGSIERAIRDASGGNDPAALRDAAVSAMRSALSGDAAQQQQAREMAAQALARAQNISVDEARAKVADYETQFRRGADEAKRQAAQVAEAASKTVTRGALFAALALLLGGLAAWFGGRAGAINPTLTSGYLRHTAIER